MEPLQKKIQDIIKKHVTQLSDKDGMTRLFGIKEAAKEITELIEKDWVEKEYCEWFIRNTSIDEHTPFYFIKAKKGQFSVDELYDFWKLTNESHVS